MIPDLRERLDGTYKPPEEEATYEPIMPADMNSVVEEMIASNSTVGVY